MPSCAVATCRNYQKSASNPTSFSFHRFPKEPSIRKQWVIRCFRKDKFNANNCKICSNHFTTIDFENYSNSSQKKLKKAAIPSVNLPTTLPTNENTTDLPGERGAADASISDMKLRSNSIFSTSSEIVSNVHIESTNNSSSNSNPLIQTSVTQISIHSESSQNCNLLEHKDILEELDNLKQKLIDLEKKNSDLEKK